MQNEFKSRIETVFEFMKKEGITYVRKANSSYEKSRNSDATYKTYSDVMKTFEKYLIEEHGLKDITRAKPRHVLEYQSMQIELFKKGECSAFTIYKFPHALHALQTNARVSGVFRGLKLGNKEDLLQNLKNQNIYRRSSDSNSLKATHSEYKSVHEQILKSKSTQKQVISDIHQFQRYIGCRIHEAVKMQKSDIVFHANNTATVYIKGKGGHERWVKVEHRETVNILKQYTEGKKDGSPIVSLKNRDNKDKTRANIIRQCEEVIGSAAKRADVNKGKVTYNSHSGRKAYAQSQMNKYAKMTKKQLQRELARRIETYPRDNHGRNRLKQKADSELEEKRKKIDPKGTRYTKKERDKKRSERELTHKELCQFLVSVDTGHFRCNIMRYYCNYPVIKK